MLSGLLTDSQERWAVCLRGVRGMDTGGVESEIMTLMTRIFCALWGEGLT